jgi:hypothetical protein
MGDETPDLVVDRRAQADRRQHDVAVPVERRKLNRRRRIDPTTCERDYDMEQLEFLRAMERFRRVSPFPSCRQVLEIAYSLGYRRVAEPTGLPGLRPPEEAARSSGENLQAKSQSG